MNSEQTHESWQVEANGQVFETNFAEMTDWIDQGALLRQDKVRKGNLRWIEAGKVPSLIAVFNAKESGKPMPVPVITSTKLNPTVMPGSSSVNPPNFSSAPAATPEPASEPANMCSVHPDVPARYACKTCFSLFCKGCPSSYGGTVKICPYCGALCEPIAGAETSAPRTVVRQSGGHFGISDFISSFGYPFRFGASLILGAIMYAFFAFGQSAVAFGGIFFLSAAIFCAMLANTLSFGVLANTVENMAQGRLNENFMPSFEDFSIWDDVIQPFFLMIGVNIVSFGPVVLVAIVAFFVIIGTINSARTSMTGAESDAARMVDPQLPYASNAVEQSKRVREILNKQAEIQKQRVEMMDDREIQPDQSAYPTESQDPEQARFLEMNKMIQDQRKAQLESAIGKHPDTIADERMAMLQQLIKRGVPFLLLGGLALIWGLFYYPAACAVAGYTRSFRAVVNPMVGFDTIRRLGVDYVKILLMCFALAICAGLVTGFLSLIFAPFNMPGVGNIPANIVGSLFGFYFSVVFALIIGSALHKAADRLELPGA